MVALALESHCNLDWAMSIGLSCHGSLSFDSVVCYKTLSSGTVTLGAEEVSWDAWMKVEPSCIWVGRASAHGELGRRALFELELARLEGFEPTTPGSEVCQETC